MSDILKIGFYQFDVVWENIFANQKKIENLLSTVGNVPDILILPEMFTTGFSMKPNNLDKSILSKHIDWQQNISDIHNVAIFGSVLFPSGDNFFNRLFYTCSGQSHELYDKKHLFLTEKDCGCYSPGNERKVFEYGKFKIMPQICYDLRFPVWSRNNLNYQVLIYVANWPAARQSAWNTLLAARAIENQCYVAGVNRVGTDNNNIDYVGESTVYSPSGEVIYKSGSKEAYAEVELSIQKLNLFRDQYPFYKDADDFEIKNPGY